MLHKQNQAAALQGTGLAAVHPFKKQAPAGAHPSLLDQILARLHRQITASSDFVYDAYDRLEADICFAMPVFADEILHPAHR